MKYLTDEIKHLIKEGCKDEFYFYKKSFPGETFIKFEYFAEKGQNSFGINVCSEEERIRQGVKDRDTERRWFEVAFYPPIREDISKLDLVYEKIEEKGLQEEELIEALKEFHSLCIESLKELDKEGLFENEGIEGKREFFLLVFSLSLEVDKEILSYLNPSLSIWQKKFKSKRLR